MDICNWQIVKFRAKTSETGSGVPVQRKIILIFKRDHRLHFGIASKNFVLEKRLICLVVPIKISLSVSGSVTRSLIFHLINLLVLQKIGQQSDSFITQKIP